MGAVIKAVAAQEDDDASLAKVKTFVEKCRDMGNERGEAAMLHKLATMAPEDEALNAAQVALELAQKVGDAREESAIKETLTDLWAAKGKIEKAPNRKDALEILKELGRALEIKNGDKF